MRLRIASIIAVLLPLTVGAVAEARVSLRISPTPPTTTDDIIVKFTAERNLRSDERYWFEFLGAGGDDESCKSIRTTISNKRPRKGQTMTMRLRALDPLVSPVSTWCPGSARLSVYYWKGPSRNGHAGPVIGRKQFTVRP